MTATSQSICNASYQVISVTKFDGRVWSVQEFVANQFCGHWHEIGWSCDLATANGMVPS